ncbi:MAG: hypothetical protein FWF68_11140 [Spirochaetes bacterium]|nr:hypothetical protein [Spirochaetota bacterium]
MADIEYEKNRLTEKLSDQYSRNVITLDEYERLLDYTSKIETTKEISIANKMLQFYRPAEPPEPDTSSGVFDLFKKQTENYDTIFSNRTINVSPKNGIGGKFSVVFGTNKIIVDNLPPGKTVINIECVFGSVEVLIRQNVKIVNSITPVFSSIDSPSDKYIDEYLPELHLKGESVFGNITIKFI